MAVKAPWTPAELRAPAWFEQGLDHGWRFFSSVRVALILILLLTAATLAGTLLAQAPGDILPGTPAYTAWLQRFRPRYGMWTDPLSTLQLFSIFGSWWFRGLIAALAVNIVVCSMNRWPGIAQAIFSPRVQVAERFFQTAPLRASLSATAEPALMAQLLRRFLALHHYRALTEEADGVVHLYADKHRFARLGTYGTHLSLILVLAGALAGGVFGFTDKQFVVPEGRPGSASTPAWP
jgi:cytochrome c biogenesis protein